MLQETFPKVIEFKEYLNVAFHLFKQIIPNASIILNLCVNAGTLCPGRCDHDRDSNNAVGKNSSAISGCNI